MNAKDFQLYLDQPQMLYALPLAELQSLAMEYPYSSNLRLLLLLKTHLEGHPDEQNYLERCASASFDRAFIYDLLQDARLLTNEEPTEDTEVLELRTLDEIALEEAALLAEGNEVVPENSLSYEEAPPVFEGEEVEEVLFAEPAISRPAEEAAPPYRIPVSRFSEGKRPEYGQSLKDRLRSIRRRQSEKLADEQMEVRKIARRSLVTQDDVASETLASLLVRQGQYQRAIKMYRRLELLYPEKKTIFAGLIKDLQEKL